MWIFFVASTNFNSLLFMLFPTLPSPIVTFLPILPSPTVCNIFQSNVYHTYIIYSMLLFCFQHPEFSFLLKERVCPLIIKLFSPSIKHRISSSPLDKPLYPVAVRLLRIVSVLIEKFYTLLVRLWLLVSWRLMITVMVHTKLWTVLETLKWHMSLKTWLVQFAFSYKWYLVHNLVPFMQC